MEQNRVNKINEKLLAVTFEGECEKEEERNVSREGGRNDKQKLCITFKYNFLNVINNLTSTLLVILSESWPWLTSDTDKRRTILSGYTDISVLTNSVETLGSKSISGVLRNWGENGSPNSRLGSNVFLSKTKLIPPWKWWGKRDGEKITIKNKKMKKWGKK